MTAQNLSNALRALSDSLQTPVILVLLILAALTIIMAGTLLAEFFLERRHMRAELPSLINALKKKERPVEKLIADSGLLKRQKKLLLLVAAQTELTPSMRESLCANLMFDERAHYELRTKITDLIMRLAPMFGLLGTLIPLGPGIIALGRGDTYTLSTSLLTAFDTTIAGLITAAAATVISTIRKQWYGRYMTLLETVAECLLEALDDETTV